MTPGLAVRAPAVGGRGIPRPLQVLVAGLVLIPWKLSADAAGGGS